MGIKVPGWPFGEIFGPGGRAHPETIMQQQADRRNNQDYFYVYRIGVDIDFYP